MTSRSRRVGPVLVRCRLAEAIVEAILAQDSDAEVIERDSYLRVSARSPCVVTHDTLSTRFGSALDLRAEFGRVMPSFRGRLSLSAEEVRWE